MNRDELAILLARRSKTTKVVMTQDEARQAIDMMVDILSETLSKPDGYVSFKGFGTLSVDRRIRGGR
ncbi:MAG: HU family DNA-binding protein, partial [Phototrophicaceae bacterium]